MITVGQLRADLGLLLRTGAGRAVWLAVLLFAAATSWMTRLSATDQLAELRTFLRGAGTDPDGGLCALLAQRFDLGRCIGVVRNDVGDISADVLSTKYSEMVESIAATSWEGALGFAARQSASIVGFIALGMVLAVHVSTLWETGAARPAIAAIGPARIVVQKSAAVFVAALLVLLASTLGTLVGRVVPVPGRLPPIEGDLRRSFVDLAHSYWMLCAVGLFTVAVAILSRQFVVTFAIVMGLMAVFFIATLDRDFYPFSPAGWIATVMGFSRRTRHTVIDYFWTAEVGRYDPVLMGLAITAFGVIPLVVAAWLLWRRKPRA